MTSAPPRELPKQLTSFIGRERELAELARLLSDARLLTIAGAPGAGKTRLALELARSVAPRFPDGTWLVDLAPVNDPQLVPLQIAAALGVTGVASERPMEAVNAHLVGARALVILDNCEHLI